MWKIIGIGVPTLYCIFVGYICRQKLKTDSGHAALPLRQKVVSMLLLFSWIFIAPSIGLRDIKREKEGRTVRDGEIYIRIPSTEDIEEN